MSTPHFATGTRIVHRHDPAWIGVVLYQIGQNVRVRRALPNGFMDVSFSPDEIKPVEQAEESETAA